MANENISVETDQPEREETIDENRNHHDTEEIADWLGQVLIPSCDYEIIRARRVKGDENARVARVQDQAVADSP